MKRQKDKTKCPKCGCKTFDFVVDNSGDVFAKCRKCKHVGGAAKTKKRAIGNLSIST